mgnify:CR=1 FL=1
MAKTKAKSKAEEPAAEAPAEVVEDVTEKAAEKKPKAAKKVDGGSKAAEPWDNPLFAALCDSIAAARSVEILDVDAFRKEMWEAWAAQVASHAYIEDKKSRGIVK